ncbi:MULTISPECIES: type 4a pilus biogenesis protein PilO [Cryobacterium]|uniref:Pilus assembly protein PilO n=1 Tax=Cryobacterium zongtaii TaxID=1259217 RepID=A0A2S3ZME8_9MICO|nr:MULTISPECIES: type 4a pilus biogenesis protein PilO [Cryobacterium]POH68485.1 hypothetical protein C3B60_04640 [Cryobacterium zongtaii]POH70102.1 hypothetical protein C3B61_00325 [Cryobacterium zongtaii]TFC49172.1 hypothetical protein E3O57_00465 [Cryobacterium sp. TMN-39-2]
MSTQRWWVIGSALVIAATLIFGWMLGVGPLLSSARAADQERLSVESQNQAYEQQLSALKEQYRGMEGLAEQLDELRSELPPGAELPTFVRQLNTIAQESSVTFTSISVSDAVSYAPVVVEGTEVAAPADDEAASAEAATDDTEAEAPVAVPGVPFSNPLITAENFVAIPVDLVLTGGYGNVLNFLEGLQTGTRLVTVTKFNTIPSAAGATTLPEGGESVSVPAAGSTVTGTISALIYVLLDPTAQAEAG